LIVLYQVLEFVAFHFLNVTTERKPGFNGDIARFDFWLGADDGGCMATWKHNLDLLVAGTTVLVTKLPARVIAGMNLPTVFFALNKR